MSAAEFIDVAPAECAPPSGEHRRFEVGGRAVLVCNLEGRLYAVAQRCTHAAWPLDDAPLEGGQLVCRLHGGRFDVRTGAACARPATRPLETFAVRVRGDRLEVGRSGSA